APSRAGATGFARADGRRLWVDSTDAAGTGATVAVGLRDTIAVLLRDDGALRALVARTGRELWRTPAQCVSVRCVGHRLVTLAGGVVVAGGRRGDGTGSFLVAHRVATGAAVETGLPTSTPFVTTIAVAADSDLVVMDQTGDAIRVNTGVGSPARWDAGLRLTQSGAAPSPFAQGATVLTQNRSTGQPVATAFDRRTGTVAWRGTSMIPLGVCGTRYLTATPDGYVLTDAATGRPTIRIQRFRTAADSLAMGTPTRPITAGLIVLSYESRTAVRVHAC
ncbi:MAG: PQQ-binding-like beta-propeller repeat protein, partial [Gemmatimonadaceae bacterium]|nr:PQQ-binding-like beta-propeller repeat protein [Gemmatimonadaceae bacterium]